MGDPRVVRFLQLLVNRGFVKEIPVTVHGLQKSLFRFGPLGALLKKNILNEWWKAVVLEQPNTFCVEDPILVPHTDGAKTSNEIPLLQNMSLRTSLSADCHAAYLSALHLNGGQLPVSVASTGQCFPSSTEDSNPDTNTLLSNGVSETQLLAQHYCPPVTLAQVMDYWLRARLRWWRKFCSNPSKLSSATSSNSEGQACDRSQNETVISYTFPWGTETVETIQSWDDASVREMEASTGLSYQGRYHRKLFYPHIVECKTSVEQCMAVFLTDAYREREVKRRDAKHNPDYCFVLQLHPQLSPYQVAMCVTGKRATEVRMLVDHVAMELREAGISVLSAPANSDSMDSQQKRNDELGVPYTVVLSDQTLDLGIISFRDRDTRLKQQQHISKLRSLLSKGIMAQDYV